MELYRDMLCRILESEEFEILLPKWKMNVEEMMEMKCFSPLLQKNPLWAFSLRGVFIFLFFLFFSYYRDAFTLSNSS